MIVPGILLFIIGFCLQVAFLLSSNRISTLGWWLERIGFGSIVAGLFWVLTKNYAWSNLGPDLWEILTWGL